MVRKIILAGALAGAAFALLIGPAAAQMPMPGMKLKDEPNKPQTSEERARQKAIDDAYREANKKIPDKSGVNDPWGNVRPLSPSANAK
jgi:hypothetical protein